MTGLNAVFLILSDLFLQPKGVALTELVRLILLTKPVSFLRLINQLIIVPSNFASGLLVLTKRVAECRSSNANAMRPLIWHAAKVTLSLTAKILQAVF